MGILSTIVIRAGLIFVGIIFFLLGIQIIISFNSILGFIILIVGVVMCLMGWRGY
jgi:uncharacterized membrane protein